MAFSLEEVLALEPYSLGKEEKRALYIRALSELTRVHAGSCREYCRILEVLGHDFTSDVAPENQPMLPVRLFKKYELHSVPREEIAKVMTSSGTSGQQVSKIFLDKRNVRAQTRVLTEIIGSFIGKKRLPLIILDTALVKKERAMFSARGAGIVGFTMFGRDVIYALDEDMNLNIPEVQAFLEKHMGEKILLFGYTYMIWQYVVQAMREAGIKFAVENGVLFHIGGWKKLKAQAVSPQRFNESIFETLGNVSIHNYYGMAEQLGSVFVECEHGHMHCSIYSDVLIRRPEDFSVANPGEKGLIELMSLLPTSYPGHVLLTEDEGEILGEDDCLCGRLGKYFKIHGRMAGAELRGCSDTYEQR